MRPAICVLALVTPAVFANGGDTPTVCTSGKFRVAFLDGLKSVDQPAVSDTLVGFGNTVVPCLEIIAQRGGRSLTIDWCEQNDTTCRVWAMRALASIKTPAAIQALTKMLNRGWGGRQLYGLLGALATTHPVESRPGLLRLLESPDPHARSWALLAVGAVGDPEDFDAMVHCARRLPVEELNRAARAFEFLGDARAVAVLRELAAPLPQGSRGDIEGAIARLERGEPIRPE